MLLSSSFWNLPRSHGLPLLLLDLSILDVIDRLTFLATPASPSQQSSDTIRGAGSLVSAYNYGPAGAVRPIQG